MVIIRLLVLIGICAAWLQGCAVVEEKQGGRDDYEAFLAAAPYCIEFSAQKETVKIPCGQADTAVKLTLYYDTEAFMNCMKYAGVLPRSVDFKPYLAVARECLNESRGAHQEEAVYVDCLRRHGIEIDADFINDPE